MTSLDSQTLGSVFYQINSDGSFQPEILNVLRTLGTRRQAVVLAFPPKAAGTFLRTAVIAAADGQLVRVVHAQGGRDATPYLPTFVHYFMGGVTDHMLVTHVHMLPLPANLSFLDAFNIRPVVMKRSIPDMLASYWDMLEHDDKAMREGLNCLIPENFRELPVQSKGDFMVDVMGPWYVNFYAGWLAQAEKHPDCVCVIDYRDFKRDPAGTLHHMLQELDIPSSSSRCSGAIAYAWDIRNELRFNKGEVGRGRAYLNPDQLARLAQQFSYYPILEAYRDELLATG